MRVSALTLLIVGAVLTGCGDGNGTANPPDGGKPAATTDSGGKPAAKDGCGLLTREEAAAAAGNAVKQGNMMGFVCIWEPEESTDTSVQVSVAYVPAMGADPAQMCSASLAGIPNAKPFPGIGNKAYWDFGGGTLSSNGSLHVCVDQGMVDTAAIGGGHTEAELQAIAVSMAKTVLARL